LPLRRLAGGRLLSLPVDRRLFLSCAIGARRDIAKLDDRTMGDLGVSASQMNIEAQKPFWRA